MILYENGSTKGNAEGTTFTINDTSNGRTLKFYKYEGQTTQTGTPTPSSPQSINVVTGNNTIDIVNSSIPNGYTRVDYIQSSGTQYINTGISPTVNTGFKIKASLTTENNTDKILIGSRVGSNRFWLDFDGSQTPKKIMYGYGSYYGLQNYDINTDYEIEFNYNGTKKITINGTTQNMSGTYDATSSIPMYIFRANYSTAYYGSYKLYYCKIYDGTTLVRDLIPCFRNSDNVVGLYDLVNNVFYTNLGGGSFTYGEIVDEYQSYEINLGKNLFDKTKVINNYYINSSGGLTSTNNISASDYMYIFGKSKIAISGMTSITTGWASKCAFYDKDKTFISYGNLNSPSITHTIPNNAYYFRTTIRNADLDTVQVEISESPTTYSPYFTPIELCKIGDYKDSIFYNKDSKNLIGLGTQLNGYTDQNTLKFTTNVNSYGFYFKTSELPNTITFNCANGNRANISYYNEIPAQNVVATTRSASNTLPRTITIDKQYTYIHIQFSYSQVATNFMLNGGTTALEYQPYEDGWYIKKNINKVVVDENTAIQNNQQYINIGRFPLNDYVGMSGTSASPNAISSHFTSRFTTDNGSIFVSGVDNKINLVNTAYANNLDGFKTWLGANEPIVYYVLSNPTYTIITDEELVEQLEALESATTYDNQTNVTQTNSGLPIYTYVEYIQPLDFSRNGLGVIPNVLNAKVVDEINGEYSLTFEYPMSEPMATELVEDRIVKCKVADGTEQCFIIKTIQKSFDKMSVYCTHLFYLLYDNFLEDTYPQNLSPKPFLDHILSRANYQLPFTTTSDISTTKTARYVRKNCVEAILGDIDNSMFNLFGMELKRDNWNIGLKARLGSDKGEKLIFGKNITGVDVNIDTTGVYTRIMPIGFDGLLLPEKYVDADNIDEYPYPRICLYEFPDIVYDPEQEGAYHNLEDAYQALRDAVNELYANGINKPLINISVNWVELSKTEEYKQYSALERVDLGDTLTCNLFGMDYTTRVIKTEYNPLTDRIDTFEIGTFQPNIATSMNKIDFDVTQINPSSILEQAQENATSLITQAMGGYVYKTNSELYIMDNEDPNQAVHVWRWNINGLGYSSTGINGNYGLAMTMDGQIVADFITTGQLNTGVINGYDSLVTTVNGNGIKIDNNYQELLGMFDNYTPTSTTTELQSTVTNIQTNTYTKQQIDTKLVDGSVQKVMTVSGTFDVNGMHYEKTNANTSTTINEVGVGVNKTDGTNDYILFAGYVDSNNTQYSDYEGQTIVASENILVKNYLVIGNNSRMENYENGTGVFYIGG